MSAKPTDEVSLRLPLWGEGKDCSVTIVEAPGWKTISGKTYYFKSGGAMAAKVK